MSKRHKPRPIKQRPQKRFALDGNTQAIQPAQVKVISYTRHLQVIKAIVTDYEAERQIMVTIKQAQDNLIYGLFGLDHYVRTGGDRLSAKRLDAWDQHITEAYRNLDLILAQHGVKLDEADPRLLKAVTDRRDAIKAAIGGEKTPDGGEALAAIALDADPNLLIDHQFDQAYLEAKRKAHGSWAADHPLHRAKQVIWTMAQPLIEADPTLTARPATLGRRVLAKLQEAPTLETDEQEAAAYLTRWEQGERLAQEIGDIVKNNTP